MVRGEVRETGRGTSRGRPSGRPVGHPACRPLRISSFFLGHENAVGVQCVFRRAGRGPERRGQPLTGKSRLTLDLASLAERCVVSSSSISQVISLPKGGGAVKGLGETFAPDLHTGTGNFTVPIILPPGRNGLEPGLSLSYSTGQGNGPFGLGWALGIPGVARTTSRGVPQYDGTDVYVLSGSEDLVPLSPVAGRPPRYRPRTEGVFARIEQPTQSGHRFWIVSGKDGQVSQYGTQKPTGAPADWRDPAALVDPARSDRVFAWKLTETRSRSAGCSTRRPSSSSASSGGRRR